MSCQFQQVILILLDNILYRTRPRSVDEVNIVRARSLETPPMASLCIPEDRNIAPTARGCPERPDLIPERIGAPDLKSARPRQLS